ncbi:hypothetical protein [Actinomyces oris]|uniref:hypothetical protein n=1 Tax=Actinomyces oris TaxID=544580 RepID=UPI00094C7022|nr:hypothetical protein [Actinomyces oris]OLO74419.1 hypothetical protein BKH16_10650 [Actinomyces oris]
MTAQIFDCVKHLEDSLRTERNTFTAQLDRHLKELDIDYAGRHDYLRDNSEYIIADTQGFIMVETAYYRYLVLRAAEIATDEDRSAGGDELLRHLARQAPAERRDSMDRVARVLERLDVHCHLADIVSGRRWRLRDLRSRRSSSVNQTVSAMIEYVNRLRGAVYEEPAALRPSIKVVKDKDDASGRALDILSGCCPARSPFSPWQRCLRVVLPRPSLVMTPSSGVLWGA